MFEKHYTPEQMEWFAERRRQVGEERIEKSRPNGRGLSPRWRGNGQGV